MRSDGTKEFIKRNGEFTVNIALIENNKSVMGVIHVPVANETYYGSLEENAYKIDSNGEVNKISVSSKTLDDEINVVQSRFPLWR
ncbi:MAG: inositol monophosphatase family protein [Melioribacteraceae bacterium]|nr:inositol monophosphatase family protein [Melioribacteraceae bacterium]